jgi:hypothetical protein
MGAIAIASAIFTTALPSTVSASDAKANECQMLSNTVVQANFKVGDLEKPSQELKFFNLMAQNIKGLTLTDARLQILRDVLIFELKDRENLWKNAVTILDKGDPREIEVLKIRLDLKRKSGRVVAEMFNEYCFGS